MSRLSLADFFLTGVSLVETSAQSGSRGVWLIMGTTNKIYMTGRVDISAEGRNYAVTSNIDIDIATNENWERNIYIVAE